MSGLAAWCRRGILPLAVSCLEICRCHGIAYAVIYRSFPDIEAAKAWMDLNQLGRRNLSKEDRDELIRRLAEQGYKQREIAEATGLSQNRISEIVKISETDKFHASQSPDLTVTARLRDQLAAAERRGGFFPSRCPTRGAVSW